MAPGKMRMMANRTGSMQRTNASDLNQPNPQLQMQLIDIDAQVAKLRIKMNSTSNIRDRAIYKDEIDRLLLKRYELEQVLASGSNYHEDIELQLIDLDAQIEKLKIKVRNISDPAERKLYLDEIENLSMKREAVKDILHKSKQPDNYGDNFRSNLENAWNDLKVSLFNLKSKF